MPDFKTVYHKEKAFRLRQVIVRRMKTILRLHGMSHMEFAELTGYQKSHVTKVLNCDSSPGLDFLICFSTALSVPLSWLVSERETAPRFCRTCWELEPDQRRKVSEYVEMLSLFHSTHRPYVDKLFDGKGLNAPNVVEKHK